MVNPWEAAIVSSMKLGPWSRAHPAQADLVAVAVAVAVVTAAAAVVVATVVVAVAAVVVVAATAVVVRAVVVAMGDFAAPMALAPEAAAVVAADAAATDTPEAIHQSKGLPAEPFLVGVSDSASDRLVRRVIPLFACSALSRPPRQHSIK